MRSLLLPSCLLLLPACLVPPGKPISADLGVDVATQYNFRGMPQNETGVLQPGMALHLPTRDEGTLHLSTWANMDLQNDVGDAWYPDGNALRFSEIDYTVTYEKNYGQTDVKLGIHNYNLPRGDRFPFGVRGATVELFGHAEYELPGSWFPFVELRADIDEAEGWYAFVGCAKPIPIDEKFTFEAESTLAYSDSKQGFWNYAIKESGLADWRTTAKLFYQFDDATRFTLLAAFSTMVDEDYRNGFDANRLETENAWVSMGVNWSY